MGRRVEATNPEPLYSIEELQRRRRVLRRRLLERVAIDSPIYRRHEERVFRSRSRDLSPEERLVAEIGEYERMLREAGVE